MKVSGVSVQVSAQPLVAVATSLIEIETFGFGSEIGRCWVSQFAIAPAKCRLVRLRRRNPTKPGAGSTQPTKAKWPGIEPTPIFEMKFHIRISYGVYLS